MNFSTFAQSKLLGRAGGIDHEEPLFYSTISSISSNSTESSIHNQQQQQQQQRSRSIGTRNQDEEDDRILDGELNELLTTDNKTTTISTTKQQIESLSSKLWERSKLVVNNNYNPVEHLSLPVALGGISRGWKTHESISPGHQVERYSELSDEEEGEEDDSDEAPQFLSPLPTTHTILNIHPYSSTSSSSFPSSSNDSSPSPTRREPLIPTKTLYIHPSKVGGYLNLTEGRGSRIQYHNSNWIVLYGLSLISVLAIGLSELFNSTNRTSLPPYILPLLPSLSLLAFLSLSTASLSQLYLFTLKTSIRKFVYSSLILAPVLFIFTGLFFMTEGFSLGEGSRGLKWVGFGLVLVGFFIGRLGLVWRKKFEKTIKVLELSTTLLLSHPSLLLLSLSLSLLSLLLSLSFLFLFTFSLNPSSIGSASTVSFKSTYVLLIYFWSNEILKGIQRVTVSGVVGGWWFGDSNVSSTESGEEGVVVKEVGEKGWELTRVCLARALHPTLGPIILSSFLLSLLSIPLLFLATLKRSLRSTQLPFFLNPLICLVPILGLLLTYLEILNGRILTWSGLTGGEFWEGYKFVKNGSNGVGGEGLLVRFILRISTLGFSMLIGCLSFYFIGINGITSGLGNGSIIIGLYFLIPYWSIGFGRELILDSVDSIILCYNFTDAELESEAAVGEVNEGKKKGWEVFGENGLRGRDLV